MVTLCAMYQPSGVGRVAKRTDASTLGVEDGPG